ncbi:unnamed protein product [Albugo candida]|uniref:Uncharacterized protein n=1 Tax=Albugo candida TaxID=65357 RepID=A0A024G4F3_9STRA|nr:unnamed protein product [Albugo candida]|eukprot:CCI41194.1 unnamed protein product [Albugo candida]
MKLTDRNDHWKLDRLGRFLFLLENFVLVEKGCDHSCSSNLIKCPLYAPQYHLHLSEGLCFTYELLNECERLSGEIKILWIRSAHFANGNHKMLPLNEIFCSYLLSFAQKERYFN